MADLVFPIIHCGVMGESCSGKSSFAASFPKPLLVVQLDGYGKDQAYLDVGAVDPTRYAGEQGQPITCVKSRKVADTTIVQVEYYHDDEPMQPAAFDRLWRRFPSLRQEVLEGRWKTVCLETFTALDLFARYRRSHGALACDKPNILSTDDVEQMLSRFNALPCNLFIGCHIDKDMEVIEGQAKRVPMGPGRLKKGFAALFASEMYRTYTIADADKPGEMLYQLQTRPSAEFVCGTRIGAPNPCYPAYRELFVNWIAKQQAAAAQS